MAKGENTAVLFLTITQLPNDPKLAEKIADAVWSLSFPKESWVYAGWEPKGETILTGKTWDFAKRTK